MVVCPVCENVQPPAEACDVCGRALAPQADRSDAAPALASLEPTRHADAAADAAYLEDLEPTLLEPAPAVADDAGAADWVERTPLDAAGEASPSAIDVEPTRFASAPDAPRDPFALAVCRYCRTSAPPGDVFCSRCGVKLDLYRPPPRPPQD